jgi:RNA-directed DNA polymerase
MVRSDGGKRESDGVVVLMIAGRNPTGGKGPDFGHAGNEGTSKGMAGTAQPISPLGSPSLVNVRRLQNRLWVAAKQSEGRRFHALYDRIYRSDVLWEAWERVRANRGAAGVDHLTIAAVEDDYGVERLLTELQDALRAGNYRPAPVRRVEIPKPDGTKRPLGIPTVKDRVVQQATKLVLEPILESDFLPCSFGFRPKRSVIDAREAIRVSFPKGRTFLFEADIQNFFGEIDRERLLSLVGLRVSDRRVLELLRLWLRAGVLADGVVSETVEGTPRGGVIPPLLANIYLHAFDRAWAESGTGELIRNTDDFVVLCTSQVQAEEAHRRATAILGDLGLNLHPDKTRVVDLREGREGFAFLGCHLRARMSGKLWERKRIIRYYPQPLAIRAVREARPPEGQGHDQSKPGRHGVGRPHPEAQPVPSGMGQLLPQRECGYHVQIHGPPCGMEVASLARQEAGPQSPSGPGEHVDPHLVPRPGPAQAHGHYPLPEGSVTMSRRPSVSCMRENRTYRSKGGWGSGPSQAARP